MRLREEWGRGEEWAERRNEAEGGMGPELPLCADAGNSTTVSRLANMHEPNEPGFPGSLESVLAQP